MQQFKEIVNELKEMYEPFHKGLEKWDTTTESDNQNIILPPWLCQSYVRSSPPQVVKDSDLEVPKVTNNILNIGVFILFLAA